MTTLKKFSNTERCPKCGSMNLDLSWLNARPDWNPPREEHLHLTCTRCQHTWRCLPLDAPEPKRLNHMWESAAASGAYSGLRCRVCGKYSQPSIDGSECPGPTAAPEPSEPKRPAYQHIWEPSSASGIRCLVCGVVQLDTMRTRTAHDCPGPTATQYPHVR